MSILEWKIKIAKTEILFRLGKAREDKAEEVIFNMKDEEKLAREGKWGRKNSSRRGNSMYSELGKSFQGLKNKNSVGKQRSQGRR